MIREVFTFLFLVTTCMSVLPNSNRVLCIESSTEQLVDSVSTSTLAGEAIPGFLLLGGMVFFIMNLAKRSAETLIAQKNSTTLVDTSVDKLELPFSRKGEALVHNSEHGWVVTQKNYEYLKQIMGFTDGKEKFEADISYLCDLRVEVVDALSNFEDPDYRTAMSDELVTLLERWVQVFRSLPQDLYFSHNELYAKTTASILDEGVDQIIELMETRNLSRVTGESINVVELMKKHPDFSSELKSVFNSVSNIAEESTVVDTLSDKVVVENIPLSWHEFLSMTPTDGLDSPALLMILAGIIGGVGGTLLIEKVLVSKD